MLKPCIVDTNVVVSGLIGAGSPPDRIVNAMLDGELSYALSADLFNEYASVLSRPAIARLHRLSDDELREFLEDIAANAVWRSPAPFAHAPDSGDDHVWALLADLDGGQLVTGDRLLLENPPRGASVLLPREFIEDHLPVTSPEDPENNA